MFFKTLFSKPNDQAQKAQLVFKIRDTSIANRWSQAIESELKRGSKIIETDRFYNFPNDGITPNSICNSINQCVAEISRYCEQPLPPNLKPPLTSDDTNSLHVYFERLRGTILSPSSIYKNGSKKLKEAIERYNIEIHRYESITRNFPRKPEDSQRIVWRWENRQRHSLCDEDYQLFQVGPKFGSVALNYCEVGKQLIDLFIDKDINFVSPENIRPLRHYSADISIFLGTDWSDDFVRTFLQDFYKWWDDINLSKLGFKKYDPKNSIGRIVVADLIWPEDGTSRMDIVNFLSQHRSMYSASIEDQFCGRYNMKISET